MKLGRGVLFSIAIAVICSAGLSAQSASTPRVSFDERLAIENLEVRAAESAELAERVVAAKESPGREFEPALRRQLIGRLKLETPEQLRERLASGNISILALGDTRADLTFTPLDPCRIIDTRSGGGALTGGAPGPTRNFKVAGTTGFEFQGGTLGGCGVPVGATSVLINFVAVNAQGGGNLKGSAFPNPIPTTGSILNYQLLNPALNIANGLLFPICDPSVSTCTFDITLAANGAGVDVVADVLGYAMQFPKAQVRSFTNATVNSDTSLALTGGGACQNFTSVAVTAPVDGKVIVRGKLTVRTIHTVTTDFSEVDTYISNISATNCSFNFGLSAFTYVPSQLPSGTYFSVIPIEGIFNVTSGSTTTFYLNGAKFGPDTDTHYGSNITAEFQPN